MRTDLSPVKVASRDAKNECFTYDFPDNLDHYGNVFVSIENDNRRLEFPVTKMNGQLGEIGKEKWEDLTGKKNALDLKEHVTVLWSFSPSEQLKEADPYDCSSVNVSLGITVFKS